MISMPHELNPLTSETESKRIHDKPFSKGNSLRIGTTKVVTTKQLSR